MSRTLILRVLLTMIGAVAVLLLIDLVAHSLAPTQPPSRFDLIVASCAALVIGWLAFIAFRRQDSLQQRVKSVSDSARLAAEAGLAWELGTTRTVASLASDLIGAADPEAASALVSAAAREVTSSDMGCAPYIDPQSEQVIIPSLRIVPPGQPGPGAERPIWHLVSDLWSWITANPRSLLVNGPQDSPLPEPELPFDSPLPRYICAPAVAHDTLLGLVVSGGSTRRYVARDLEALERLAGLYALTLQRQWAQQAVRSSEARHRSLYEGVPVGLYRTTPTGQIVDANPALVELLGFPDRESLLAMSAASFYVDPDERRRQGTELAANGVVHGAEMALRRNDGAIIWVRNTMRAVRENGAIRYHEGTLEDVTARRLAEEAEKAQRLETEALRETAAALSSATSLEEVFDLVLERVGQVVPCDAATALLIRGESAQVTRVRQFGSSAPPAWDPKLRLPLDNAPHLRHMQQTGETVVIDDTRTYAGWFQAPESDWIRSVVSAPVKAKGKVIGFLSLDSCRPHAFKSSQARRLRTFADQVGSAVENARLYQAAIDERARLHALIATDPSGTIFIDSRQRVLVINRAALNMLQLQGEPKDWLGRHFLEALVDVANNSEVAAETARDELARLRSGDSSLRSGELTVNRLTLQWSNQPVEVNGVSLGRLVLLRDVTAERAVTQLREEMVHMLVHDLRNPLGIVLNALQLLAPDELDGLGGEQRQILEIAQGGAQRLMDLVNRILELAHMESGRLPLHRRQVLTGQLIEDVMRQMSAMAIHHGINFEGDVASDLPVVRADEELISRVLQNLIDNALKFTLAGGTVRVSAALERNGAGPNLLVSVANMGDGIPQEVLPHLFQKFARGNQQGRGSGLGLAFCKLAVEAHGGQIWAADGEDGWTRFSFTLPAES